MDTPEQEPKEPTKHTRVRLAAPRKQLERTIQKMTKLSETAENAMKPEKLVDLLTTLAGLQVKLLDTDRDAKQDALIEENERLKSELAARPTNNEIYELKNQLEWRNMQFEPLQNEVATLKSQSANLQEQNTELVTTNNELKSTNSKLTQQVQTLQEENAKLQCAVMELTSRTPGELLAEASAKMDEQKRILGG